MIPRVWLKLSHQDALKRRQLVWPKKGNTHLIYFFVYDLMCLSELLYSLWTFEPFIHLKIVCMVFILFSKHMMSLFLFGIRNFEELSFICLSPLLFFYLLLHILLSLSLSLISTSISSLFLSVPLLNILHFQLRKICSEEARSWSFISGKRPFFLGVIFKSLNKI